MVVVTRRDLLPGYQLVQSCHAVADYVHQNPYQASSWAKLSNSIITLSVANEKELRDVMDKLSQKYDTEATVFREPDIDNQITAISFLADSAIRKKFRHLPLALKGIGQGVNKHSEV